MDLFVSDQDLLDSAAQRLGLEAETLMGRYYGSPDDAYHELEEFHRTGRLQASLAELLRLELGMVQVPAE
jgi:hypothetical protein